MLHYIKGTDRGNGNQFTSEIQNIWNSSFDSVPPFTGRRRLRCAEKRIFFLKSRFIRTLIALVLMYICLYNCIFVFFLLKYLTAINYTHIYTHGVTMSGHQSKIITVILWFHEMLQLSNLSILFFSYVLCQHFTKISRCLKQKGLWDISLLKAKKINS